MKLAPRVATAVAAAALVLPASAGAHVRHARPATAQVAHHVKLARHALHRLQALSGTDPASALAALRVARHETAAASRAAKRLHAPRAAATALGAVATQYDQDFSVFGELLGSAGGPLQTALAQALQPALNGRQQALAALQQLIGQLPPAAQSDPAQLIAQLTQAMSGEVGNLSGLLNGGELPEGLQQLISQALATASNLVQSAVGQLQALIPALPPEAQGLATQLSQAIAALQQLLQGGLPGLE